MDIANTSKTNEFNIKCKYHKDQNVILMNVGETKVNTENQQIVYCVECLSEGNIQGRFVNINNVLNAKNQHSVKNWPFYESEDTQKLFERSQIGKATTIKSIEKQFDSFRKQMNFLIDELQKKSIIYLEENKSDQIIQEICTNSQLKQLSQILTNHKQHDQLEQSLYPFIQQCSNVFKKQEEELNKQKQFIDFNQILTKVKYIQDTMLNQIEEYINLIKINGDLNKKSLLHELKMESTSYSNNQEFAVVEEQNDKIQLTLKECFNGVPQIASSFIIDPTSKYLLRVEFNTQGYSPCIGLISSRMRNIKHIYEENLCYYLNYGLTKVIKGKKLYELKPKEIEIFISKSDNLLLIADYPNHENVNSLEDNNDNLKKFNNLLIAFSQGQKTEENIFVIKEFYQVSQHPNW